MSVKTAVEIAAQAFGRSATDEVARVEADKKVASTQAAGMYPSMGGDVSSIDELPPGAERKMDSQESIGDDAES
jgi:hypothetical protein